jgi:hypothetical protein
MIKLTALFLSLCLLFSSSLCVTAGEQNTVEGEFLGLELLPPATAEPVSTEPVIPAPETTEPEGTEVSETEATEVSEPELIEDETTEAVTAETDAIETEPAETESTEPETVPETTGAELPEPEITEPAETEATEPQLLEPETPEPAEVEETETPEPAPRNMEALAAGATRSFWLRSNGTVAAVGGNGGKTNAWREIQKISACKYAVGLKHDGTLVTEPGILGETNIRNWVNIVDLDTSENNTIALTAEGTVVVAGSSQDVVPDWTDILVP